MPKNHANAWFFMLWRRNFLYWNRRWHFAFSASKEDLNGRFFIFKRCESRFGEKFPNTALFYCEKLSQSLKRFLGSNAEPVESHYSRLVRHYIIAEKRIRTTFSRIEIFRKKMRHKVSSPRVTSIDIAVIVPKCKSIGLYLIISWVLTNPLDCVTIYSHDVLCRTLQPDQ